MMKKSLFSFYKIFVVAVLLFGFGKVSGQGAETFSTQTALTSVYADGTFAGETSGVTVNFVHSRDEGAGTADEYAISGKGLMLRRADEPSSVEFVILNGVGTFTFKYRKAFTGGTNTRVLAVVVDGVQKTLIPAFGAAGADATIGTSNTVINKAGTVTVKITFPAGTANGNKQITVDDISWTAHSATPANIALSSANPASTTGNLVQGSNNNVIYGFNLAATDAVATLNQVDFQTVVGYSSSEVSNYKLWYSTDATFSSGSDTNVATLPASAAGAKSFSGFTQAIAKDATGYFFITTDVPCTADVSLPPTIKINAITTAGLTFSSTSVVKSGTAYAGATHTFTSSTPTNVSAAATSCVSGSAKVSWTNPSNCFDQVFVFAKAGSFSTAVPTGNGSLYTASTSFSSGSSFDGGFLIYKGSLATITALGLTNGTTYTYKIFTRKDTKWSNGIGTEVSCTPTIAYCDSSGTTSFNTGIRGVVFNTINNISQPISTAGYTDFTTISTTVQAGNPYNLSIYVNTAGSYTVHTRAWIDWNQNGTFEASEQYELGTANNNSYILTSASPFTITVPVGASLGNTRMRISTKYNSVSTSCESGFDGETEDYTINIIAACTPPTDPVGTISGTTPACTSTVLTYTGADSATAYWQTTATGTSTSEPATSTKTVSTSGTYYVRIYSGTCWSTNSKNLTVVINDAPSITTQPANQIVYVGTPATFSVVATGTGLTYQWQVDKGAGFANVTGADGTATTSSFQTVATTLAMTGYKYRVNITGTCGNLASDGLAVLTVSATPICTPPIWEENFDYGCVDNPSILSIPEASVNWTVRTVSPKYNFNYDAGGNLSFSGYPATGGGAARYVRGASRDNIKRLIKSDGSTVTSGTIYSSFLVNFNNNSGNGDDYFFTFKNQNDVLRGHIHLDNSTSSGTGTKFKFGVSKAGSSTSDAQTGEYNFGTTYLCVVKYEIISGSNNDKISLWIFDSGVPASEATAGPATITSSVGSDWETGSNGEMKYVLLRQTSGGADGLIDGIRVGTTWDQLFCGDLPPSASIIYTWTGAVSTAWGTACNWSPSGVPVAKDHVIFNSSTPTLNNNLNLTDTRIVTNFTLNGTGNLALASTGVLTINGDVTYDDVNGATAALDCASHVNIKSSTSQTVPWLTYGNLDIIGGDRSFQSGRTIKICSGFAVEPDDASPKLYTYTYAGSTVEYISSSGWYMIPFSYHNLTFSGNGSFDFGGSSPAANKLIKVKGNYLQSAGSVILGSVSGYITTLNIDGDMSISAGNFDVNKIANSYGILNLKGDLNVSDIGQLTGTVAGGAVNFIGSGDGSTEALTQSIDIKNANSVYYTTLSVNSGFTKLINQDLHLGTNSSFEVKNGAIFNFGYGTDNLTALNIVRVTEPTMRLGQSFTSYAGSTLKITSPYGISNGTSVYTGNVQIGSTAASRVFDKGTTYHYIGKVNQATGNGIPDQMTSKLIVELDTQNITQDDLQFTSTGTTTFGTVSGINGILEIRKGKVIDQPSFGFRNYNGALDDGETDIQRGDIIMSGGRYVVSGAGTKPSLSGIYTISAGTVEFTGSEVTKIRTSSPPKQYYNVDVSGTNVETGGKNFIVNNLLKVTSPTAVLTIPETPLDSDNPYVVTAKNGIQVLAGKALFKNNANLMQETTANNIGNITMDRKTKMVKMDYTYWSSPVAGQRLTNTINPNLETSSGGFSPGTPNSRIFEYIEATDLFKATSDANFVAGKGYAIRGKNSFGTTPTTDIFQFEGNPNNGNSISFNITKSPNSIIEGVSYEHGYNIIGNPYPSNINFAKFYDLNEAVINAKAWYWTNASPHLYMEGSTYNGNNYATVTLAGGVPPTYIPSSGNYKPTNIIKVGQGFIIQAKATPTSVQQNFTINFNNDIRESGIGVFYNNVGKLTPENRYWLRMKSPSDIVNTILIGHFPNATDGYDANYDAELFTLGDDSLYSILDERKLQIQAKGDFQEDAQFILGTQFAQAGIYRFELEDPEGVFANEQSIYLYDKLKNTYTNLSQNSYQFETGKGKAEGRFEIVYKPGTTLVTDNRVKGLVQVYRSGDYFVVKSSDSKIEEIEVYDATGRLYQQVKGGTEEVKIDAATLTNGLYILKIKRKNETISKKIIK